MPLIELETEIAAPREKVFDLARNIDVHMASTKGTNERAVAGRTSGLIKLHETVTWEARHFGFKQKLTVQITQMESPAFFEDRMIKGIFYSMHHQHFFIEKKNMTLMRDLFEFKAPCGVLGRLVEKTFF